jgi:hypothetical protein
VWWARCCCSRPRGLLVLILLAAAFAAAMGKGAERPDRRALLEFAVLVIALAGLTKIPVPFGALRQ